MRISQGSLNNRTSAHTPLITKFRIDCRNLGSDLTKPNPPPVEAISILNKKVESTSKSNERRKNKGGWVVNETLSVPSTLTGTDLIASETITVNNLVEDITVAENECDEQENARRALLHPETVEDFEQVDEITQNREIITVEINTVDQIRNASTHLTKNTQKETQRLEKESGMANQPQNKKPSSISKNIPESRKS